MAASRNIFGPARRKRHFGILVLATFLTIGIWIYGLFEFVDMIPTMPAEADTPTEAIVVLTGGSDRLSVGLTLLAAQKAQKLFVSGVYRGNDVKRLLEVQKRNPSELLCCVTLGYTATSTAGNAVETAGWVKEQGYKSIRLVTANYHMPRSLLEFHHTMPNIKILPHPVFPEQFKFSEWWQWPGTATLIIQEYTKYIVASAERNFERLLNTNNSRVPSS